MLNSSWKQDASGRLITLWTCEEAAETPRFEEDDAIASTAPESPLSPFARSASPGWYNLTVAGLALISFAAILVAIGSAL